MRLIDQAKRFSSVNRAGGMTVRARRWLRRMRIVHRGRSTSSSIARLPSCCHIRSYPPDLLVVGCGDHSTPTRRRYSRQTSIARSLRSRVV